MDHLLFQCHYVLQGYAKIFHNSCMISQKVSYLARYMVLGFKIFFFIFNSIFNLVSFCWLIWKEKNKINFQGCEFKTT